MTFEFEVATVLLASIAVNKRPNSKHGGSVSGRKLVRRKLFDGYFADDESTAMAGPAAGKKTLRPRHAATVGSTLARRPRTGDGLAVRVGGKDGVPVRNMSAGEAPMTGRQKRKGWMQAKEAQVGENSAEEATECGLDKRREAKPNPKYPGPEWVR